MKTNLPFPMICADSSCINLQNVTSFYEFTQIRGNKQEQCIKLCFANRWKTEIVCESELPSLYHLLHSYIVQNERTNSLPSQSNTLHDSLSTDKIPT